MKTFKNKSKYDYIIKKVKQYNKIICIRHIIPDGDSYGSTMGFARFIKDNFKNKKVLVDGKDTKYLNFLGKNDLVTKNDYEDALILVFDTSIEDRIDSDFFKFGKEIIKIDHHIHKNTDNENFADFSLVEDTSISTCEIVAKIILNSKLKLSKETAKFLMTGIITDSGRFRFHGTNSMTFFIASKLLETGLQLKEIYDHLYINDFNYLKLQAICISKIKISKNGVAYISFKKDEIKKNDLLDPSNIKLHLNIMSNIKQIKIWLLAIEDESKNNIRINLRSTRYIINDIAEKYNGGGHRLASGCKLNSWQELPGLLNDLEKVIKNKQLI